MNASNKYGLVRAIAFILKLLAWVALVLGIVAAIVSASAGGNAGPLAPLTTLGAIVGPVVGIIWFVQLFAFGSILSLLVDIEENTRVLAETPGA